MLCGHLLREDAKLKKTIVVFGACLLIGGVAYMHLNKTKITAVCKDARLFMDGGYGATITSGGIKKHTSITVFQKYGSNRVPLGTFDVKPVAWNGKISPTYATTDFKLSVSNEYKEQGYPAKLSGKLQGHRISVAMNCIGK